MAKRTSLGTGGTGRRGVGVLGWAVRGAAAGAAGTTALYAVTYLDMAIRGRAASSTPERTVAKLAEQLHLPLGEGEKRENRLQGLGALTGLGAGIGMGAVVGLVRAAGLRWRPVAGTALVTAGVMAAANGPMVVLGITDPRTWSAADWISDVLPHLAYGAVVTTTMGALDHS
jgi:hypothetical protein